MKRFLMYVVVLIGLLFVGFTTYYFVMNKENIYLNFEQDSTVYYNIDESFTLGDVLTHTDPYNETTVTIECADQSIVQYNAETQTFTTLAPGSSNITITTNNPDFARFAFTVVVCDGSTTELAFAVKTAEDLAKVGSGEDGWDLNKHYRLVNNIDLNTPTTSNWTPIGLDAETGAVQAFTGEFLGYDNTISNLNITNEIDPTGAPTLTYAGLFAQLGDSAVVESVFFNNCTIDGAFTYAGLVAATSYGKIGMIDAQNIVLKNNATIESPATMGGIVGNASIYELNGNLSARPEIYMCQVSINELSGVGLIGGLVGSALGTIISDSNVTVRSGSVSGSIGGGIAGMFACYIKEGSTDYRFGIIQNVYAITQFDVVGAQDDSFVGNIIGLEMDSENDFDMTNTYTNIFMNSNGFAGVGTAMLLSADLSSGEIVELEVATALTDTQLKDQSSYTGFDFEGIWGITEGSYAHLTFELASYNHIIPFDVGVPISSREGAVEAFNAMREHAGVATTYTFSLTENIVLTPADFGGNAVWAPIGTSEEPFAGTIVFTTPFSLTLSGFTVETTDRVSGIFGYVTGNIIGNGRVENGQAVIADNENNYFILENITNNSGGHSAGTLAGIATGTIANIKVYDADITSSANYVGGLVGLAEGNVRNILVSISENEGASNRVKVTTSAVVGGVIGQAYENTSNLRVLVLDIEVESTDSSSATVMGGVIGRNGDPHNHPTATGLVFDEGSDLIETTSTGIVAGGLVAENYGSVTQSRVLGNISLMTNELNGKHSMTGGLVGKNLGYSSSLTLSYYDGSRGRGLKGVYIGGLAGLNQGTISQCFSSSGEISGIYVGGLVAQNYARVEDSYTTTSLVGAEGARFVCGLAYQIEVDRNLTNANGEQVESLITRCFVTSTFTGNGEKYAETNTPFRLSGVTGWLNGPAWRNRGQVENCIILNPSQGIIQKVFLGMGTGNWISVNEEDVIGENARSTFTRYTFADTIWDFDSTTIIEDDGTTTQTYPTLKNVKLVEA